jgi:tetratricopeptide (TPR) repeat protein
MFFLLLLISPAAAHAETFEVVTEGEYVMGAGETMAVAEERALRKAQQAAAEQAGAFVKSYSQVKNLSLGEDVIEVTASHAMKVSVLDRKKSVIGDLDAIRFQVRIKAVLTTEEVETNLKKVREDRGIVEAYARLKADYERQTREIEALKKKLAGAAGDEKKRVLAEIAGEEKRFRANLWLEKGDASESTVALTAYSRALEWNPALAAAYVGRARIQGGIAMLDACYQRLNKEDFRCPEELEAHHRALADLDRAIGIDGSHAAAYAGRASVLANIKSMEWAIAYGKKEEYEVLEGIRKKYDGRVRADIDRAIALDPQNPRFYDQRSRYFDPVNEIDRAIEDATRAIALCRETACGSLPLFYTSRAIHYENAGRKDLAEKDRAAAKEALDAIFNPAESASLGGEAGKLQDWLYPRVALVMDDAKKAAKLREVNDRIGRKEGSAEDYMTRADLDDRNSQRDYDEAIARLQKRGAKGRDALLLARIRLFKALRYRRDGQTDAALTELKEARGIIDFQLPRVREVLSTEKFRAMMAETSMDRVARWSREEAEAFTWLRFLADVTTDRANLLEEIGLNEKAGNEYRFLCETLKDPEACRSVERLK